MRGPTTAQPNAPRRLHGHRAVQLGVGPFAGVAPVLVMGTGFALAVAAVAVAGPRWSAVHLFTLGLLSPLLVAFSQQFARSVTRTRDPAPLWQPLTVAAGAIALAVGLATEATALVAAGGTATLVAVAGSLRRLVQLRRAGTAGRFGWLLRAYEAAHVAFLGGGVLGVAMGVGLLPPVLYGAVRTAHLHANLGGWAGLTILATVVFFAPAMLRTRLTEGLETTAVAALRNVGAALVVAVAALLASRLPGAAGAVARLIAGGALLVYAASVIRIAAGVATLARRAHPCPTRPLLVAALGWFSAAAVADAGVVATGAWRWLDAVGIVLGIGVAGQLILAVALYLLPSLRGRGFAVRDALIARTEAGAGARAALLNVAVGLLAVTAIVDVPALAWLGWVTVAAVAGQVVAIAAWPVRAAPERARSSVARRYRNAPGSADV